MKGLIEAKEVLPKQFIVIPRLIGKKKEKEETRGIMGASLPEWAQALFVERCLLRERRVSRTEADKNIARCPLSD